MLYVSLFCIIYKLVSKSFRFVSGSVSTTFQRPNLQYNKNDDGADEDDDDNNDDGGDSNACVVLLYTQYTVRFLFMRVCVRGEREHT